MNGSSRSHQVKELDFSAFRVDSRIQAFESLGTVYQNAKHPPAGASRKQRASRTNMILISGVSGTGKSTLVDQFVNEVNKKSDLGKDTKPHFLVGKYNKKSGSDPFSAIVTAFSDFAKALVPSNPEGYVSPEAKKELARLRDQIREKVGNEAQQLTKVIPDLHPLLGENSAASSSTVEDDNTSKEEKWNQLKYVFQAFVRAISTKERPLVLFLDDLQWIDDASLKLLYSVLIDSDLKHFMFIGAYRSDEVNSGDPLWSTLERVQMVQEFETIELTNLSKSQLGDFVTHTLCLQGQLSKGKPKHNHHVALIDELADMLHKKTDGNLFFASQTIKELGEKEVFVFSVVAMQWELDWTTVDKSEFFTDDVMKMITGKIKQSSDLMQQILKTMAFTKSPIEILVLRDILNGEGVKMSLQELVEELDMGCTHGLLSHKIGSPDYNFSHDKIQEAARSLVAEGDDRRAYRLSVGMQLLKMYNSTYTKDDWMLFVATDHLNAARENESEFLFHLNIKAGEKAASATAYYICSKFLRRALAYLSSQPNPWESKYDLSLRTHQTLAEVLLLQGEQEDGKQIAQTLLDNAKSIDDKLPTLVALSFALGKEYKHRESMEVSLAALRNLKVYPKTKIGVITDIVAGMLAVKRFFKRNTDDDLLNLPPMKNDRIKRAMQLLSSTLYQAQFSGETLINLGVLMKMLKLTFKYGVCGESVISLIVYSIIVDSLNDIDERKRLMKLAYKLMKKSRSSSTAGYAFHLVSANYFDCWNKATEDVLASFERAYLTGMEYGQYENAFLCATMREIHKHISGFPLPGLLLEFESLRRKMSLHAVDSIDAVARETHYICQVLTGEEELDFVTSYDFKSMPCDPSQAIFQKLRCVGGMQLGLYFGNLEFCEKMITENSRLSDEDRGFPLQTEPHYFSSLCFSSLYLKTSKKSYLRQAKKSYKALMKVALPRGDNCRIRSKIMKVHLAACQQTKSSCSDTQKIYDEVIADAAATGYKHDAGLVAQLAADYFSYRDDQGRRSRERRDTQISKTYLEQALHFYKIWGADALVGNLEDRIDRIQVA